MYSKMVYNKICFLLIILLFIINTGCNNTQSNINDTGCNNIQSNINDKKQEYENKEKIDNPYFMKKRESSYKGDFTFSDNIDTKDVNVKCIYLGASENGELYQLKFDPVEGADIPEELLSLGYFYVREEKIFRILEMSEKQKEKILVYNKIPKEATIVCQMKQKRDKNKEKGIHEKIIINNDMIEYCYYDDSVTTNFYETIVWKRNAGIVLYRRGYAAELNAITLWQEKYIENPHEFNIE